MLFCRLKLLLNFLGSFAAYPGVGQKIAGKKFSMVKGIL